MMEVLSYGVGTLMIDGGEGGSGASSGAST